MATALTYIRLLEKDMQELAQALLKVDPRDGVKVAHLQGRHEGLSMAMDHFRKHTHADRDDDL